MPTRLVRIRPVTVRIPRPGKLLKAREYFRQALRDMVKARKMRNQPRKP